MVGVEFGGTAAKPIMDLCVSVWKSEQGGFYVRVRLSSWIRHITMCARTACAMRSRIRGRVVNHARLSFCKIWDPRGVVSRLGTCGARWLIGIWGFGSSGGSYPMVWVLPKTQNDLFWEILRKSMPDWIGGYRRESAFWQISSVTSSPARHRLPKNFPKKVSSDLSELRSPVDNSLSTMCDDNLSDVYSNSSIATIHWIVNIRAHLYRHYPLDIKH
jgi:hypothetical protein